MQISLLLFSLLLSSMTVNSFYFVLEEGKQECFNTHIIQNDAIILDYHILDKLQSSNGQKIKVQFEATNLNTGKSIMKQNIADNKEGEIEILNNSNDKIGSDVPISLCFITDSYHWFAENKRLRIEIDYHTIYPQNKDDDKQFAKLEDLQPIFDLNLDLDQGIHQIQQQVNTHQEISWRLISDLESTNMNIVSLASLQFLCLIVLAIMQLLYLRRFIARKNL